MSKKLQSKDALYLGSMLFGMLFGAGNLIFPVHLGQESGALVGLAVVGLLISAIGLPFLTILAMGMSKSKSVTELANRVSKKFGAVFTVLLYLVIGPLFAVPRLASTSYTIGLAPFIESSHQGQGLLIYSVIFFLVAGFLSLNPGKILDYIGKILNPAFLLVLGLLLTLTALNPMGQVGQMMAQGRYAQQAMATGFLEGYQTLDVLAALAFGIVMIQAMNRLGIEEPGELARGMVKSGAISIVLMGLIYALLAYAGATSLGQFSISANGGIALAQIANHYLGSAGSILLALIVILACLKTGVGLLTAFSEAMVELFPSLGYKQYLLAVSLLATLIANAGLTQIIAWAVPVLMFLYPLAIVLVMVTLLCRGRAIDSLYYQWAMALTGIVALIDGIQAMPELAWLLPLKELASTFATYLPLSGQSLGWFVPSLLGLAIAHWQVRRKAS
ncbi:branched-chain amino acid transport system II carrier protein [Abiotrophia defectiva]|uniref:branched-chain amino acid transport system II carrier protein n=1 Tax=Abiotrophia defectiva TaxID=46125 RepID=UPI0028D1BA8D|nr:branched-chain amino acid transport system II carrier protein [Abiotrophia defectiva]